MMDTFNGGYTKALVDVQAYIKNHSQALRYCRLYNRTGIEKLIDALVENREELRETGDVNLVWNKKEKVFIRVED